MRLTGSRAYYTPSPPKMPPGLMELMEGLTREVLKHNPSDVYGFCASHMHQLLEKRDGPSLKKSLDEKIARAQEKVRLRAEIRRQVYDKNIMLLQKNGNAINNEVKNLTEQVLQSPAAVPDGVSIVVNKDTLKSPVHDVAQNSQNFIKPPVHHEQVSGEMEISQSGLDVSKPEDSVTKSKDNEGNMKKNDSINEEKCENLVVTESNYEPIENRIATNNSSNAEPRTETVNKELTNDIISDTSKSPHVTEVRKANQQHELNTNRPLDFVDTIKEIVEKNTKVIVAEYATVNTVDIGDNLSESSTDDIKESENLNNTENAKIEHVHPSSQFEAKYGTVNTTIEIGDNLSESSTDHHEKSKNLNNTENAKIENVQPSSQVEEKYGTVDTTVEIGDNLSESSTDHHEKSKSLNNTENAKIENVQPSSQVEEKYGTVNTTVEIGNNLSESSTDDIKQSENLNNTENAKIEHVQTSSQFEAKYGTVNTTIEIGDNLPESSTDHHEKSKNLNNTENAKIENVQPSSQVEEKYGTVNTTVGIGDNLSESSTDHHEKSKNLNNTENAKIENVQPPSQVEEKYGTVNTTTFPTIRDSDPVIKNVEQFQHTEKNELSAHIEDVQQSINYANSQIASDIPKTGSDKEVQNLNDTPGTLQPDNTSAFLSENSSDTSPMSSSEKNTQPKCDDVPVNSPINDDLCNKQENTENTCLNLHDITAIKTPVLETGVDIDFQTAGVDSDIPTLVTENSGNDTNEIKVSENDTLQTASSLENMSEVYKENADTENISTYMNSNNVDTTQGEMLSNVNVTNAENQGTNTMDLETAAVTIQKVFRNFLFKSRGSTFEDATNDEGNFLDGDKNKEECDFSIANALNIDRRAHGITRMDTVLQTVNEEKSLSLSTDDSSTLSSAATIIQAHVRGFLVRNKINSNKTISTNSLAASNSNEPSITSIEANNGSDQNKNKTILNIHIVPEGGNYLSRDESLITSMDLSLDSSPPSSINLHPLGYDISERRKQLKREDAIQSISPPSNNSGKLSEDFDSVKELPLNDQLDVTEHTLGDNITANGYLAIENGHIQTSVKNGSLEIISKGNDIVDNNENNTNDPQMHLKIKRQSLTKMSSDEMDVVTPYMSHEDLASSNLMHSGEFHDAVLPTRVSRSDTSVVSGE